MFTMVYSLKQKYAYTVFSSHWWSCMYVWFYTHYTRFIFTATFIDTCTAYGCRRAVKHPFVCQYLRCSTFHYTWKSGKWKAESNFTKCFITEPFQQLPSHTAVDICSSISTNASQGLVNHHCCIISFIMTNSQKNDQWLIHRIHIETDFIKCFSI